MSSSVRRTPVQQRSVERVNRMLDVAAELLDEGGYEALSTRTVAARTGMPIGTIYRFFRNKRGLADALTRRNLDRFLERIAARLSGVTHWDPLVDVVVDEYLDMKAHVPGFAVLDFGANADVADALALMVAERVGLAYDDGLRRTVLTAVEAADGLLRTYHSDPLMVAETKELLHAYLGKRFTEAHFREV